MSINQSIQTLINSSITCQAGRSSILQRVCDRLNYSHPATILSSPLYPLGLPLLLHLKVACGDHPSHVTDVLALLLALQDLALHGVPDAVHENEVGLSQLA